ncbi:MAG: hypothetical protein ACFFCX_14640 [Candidatus Sifarchaeia archaeon]
MARASDRIRLESYRELSTLRNPLRNFEIDTHAIEVRHDPLTGEKSLVGLRLMEKYETLVGSTDEEFLNNLVSESIGKCFFCPDKVNTSTPMFTNDILTEGRISIGESILFPNLYPLSKYHAIVVPSKAHFLRPNEFSPSLLRDAFLTAQKFISHLPSNEPLYGSINANYMPPAGASSVHPHLQVIISSQPMNYARKIQNALLEYRNKHGYDYWQDLIELEKELDERFIAEMGAINWLTLFSPSGTNEVLGILPVGSYKDSTPEIINYLAQGISNVLNYYGDEGYSSFNFSMDLGNLSDDSTSVRSTIRLVTRQNFSSGYRAGEHFFQHLLNTEVVVIPPEIVAEKLRIRFRGL